MKMSSLIRSSAWLLLPQLFFLYRLSAQISTGVKSGTAFTTGGSGGLHFNNAANVQASDNNRSSASAVLSLLTSNTDEIRVSGFNFSIPSGTIIQGIVVEVEKSAENISILASVSDNSIRLLKAGTKTGSNYAKPGNWTTTDTYTSYGGNNDLWGAAWTHDEINNSGFGVSVSSSINGLIGLLPSARIDHIRMTVYYSHIVLPVYITEFHLSNQDDNVLVSWKLANADDLNRVELQRSPDAVQWFAVSSCAASETGSYLEYYPKVKTYYRLKLFTRTGSAVYSKIVTARKLSNDFFVYPNPGCDNICIKGVTDSRLLKCIAVNGILYPLLFTRTGEFSYSANVRWLPEGAYIISDGTGKILFNKR